MVKTHHVRQLTIIVSAIIVNCSIFIGGRATALTTTPPEQLHAAAAMQKAKQYDSSSLVVGFALYDAAGNRIAAYNGMARNSSASITKSMLLVAYLRQVGSRNLSKIAQSELSAMIRFSDNNAANWVYGQLRHPVVQINSVAHDAGMTNFTLVVQPGYPYIIGQSSITARDFARFFSTINTMFPGAHQGYALYLLSHLSPADQKGLLQAELPGTVYSKEGWSPLDYGRPGYPYVVNQAARFNYNGTWYGVAVTVGRLNKGSYGNDEATGEAIIRTIVHALVAT